jgi:alpha-soluble NSF attachment protein
LFFFQKQTGQDVAAAIDEEDVAKFTEAVKEFDSMTPLVSSKL